MEVLYHIRPYFGGICPYIALKNRPYIWQVPPFQAPEIPIETGIFQSHNQSRKTPSQSYKIHSLVGQKQHFIENKPHVIASGKVTQRTGKSACLMGKSTISMSIFQLELNVPWLQVRKLLTSPHVIAIIFPIPFPRCLPFGPQLPCPTLRGSQRHGFEVAVDPRSVGPGGISRTR